MNNTKILCKIRIDQHENSKRYTKDTCEQITASCQGLCDFLSRKQEGKVSIFQDM